MTTPDLTATDQLDRDIREIVKAGDADTIVRMLALTRNLNTQIELENQALREFVAVADEWTSWCVCCMDEYEQEFRPVMQRYYAIRQRLATDHNLPLPGDRRTGADAEAGG